MNLEEFFERIVFEIAKYTVIPGIIVALVKTPIYSKEVLFAILVVLNWIILTEFKMRDTKTKINYLIKKLKMKKKRK